MDDVGGAERAFHLLVADALQALIPLVDDWAGAVGDRPAGGRSVGFRQGYRAGVRDMASEVKDQLIERILALRQTSQS